MKHIKDIPLPKGGGHPVYEPFKQKEKKPLTRLNQFKFNHVSGEQKTRLMNTVRAAQNWDAGAFVIAGTVGVGKTTIAANLLKRFEYSAAAVPFGDDDEYVSIMRAAIDKFEVGHPTRVKLEADLERNSQPAGFTANAALMVDETQVLQLAKGHAEKSLYSSWDRVRAIAIDDIGAGEMPFVRGDEVTQRQRRHARYRLIFDVCYRKKIHLIITSMEPMRGNGGQVRPEFVDLVGEAAFSRLVEMAAGNFYDLTGLPDYRPFLMGSW